MDIKTIKKELINWVKDLDDIETLKALIKVKEQGCTVSWDDMPQTTKDSINRAEEDITAGRTTPHEEIRKSYEKWLK